MPFICKMSTILFRSQCVNLSVPCRCDSNFKCLFFKHILLNIVVSISSEIALWWMPEDLIDEKSTLVQVMACCHQATSHYLNQCWPSSLTLNDITRPQWVNALRPRQNGWHFAYAIFKCILLNEKWISIEISLTFISNRPINNIPALVQIMAWCQPDDKPWSEAMMVRLPTHICVTMSQASYMVSAPHCWNPIQYQCWLSSLMPYGINRPQWVNPHTWFQLLIVETPFNTNVD